MKKLRERRKEVGVSLDELAVALGPGFSHARLSIAERGLIQLSPLEQEVISAAVERLGEVRVMVREAVEIGVSADRGLMCADLRQKLQAQAAS